MDGGRIAYPKPYWQIMQSKKIDKEIKIKALAAIRKMHSDAINGENYTSYNPKAENIDSLCWWDETPEDFDFWSNLNKIICVQIGKTI